MIAEYVRKTNVGVGVGVALQLIGRILLLPHRNVAPLAVLVIVVGAGFFLWGCRSYSQAKGYSPVLGFVLGLLSCFGLIVLVVLPDRTKTEPLSTQSGPGGKVPPPM